MKIRNKGITLIALIITIILMLILAGVVISLTIGEKGLIQTAKYAVTKTEQERAREKLELALADLSAYKYINYNYNENEYINKYLNNEGMVVIDNVVTVDNWNFEIDRSIPAIKATLGASEIKLTKEVKEYLGKNENDKYMVAVLVKIESNTQIESIEFENIDGTILTVTTENQILTKDMQIELDREYKITVKMVNGKTENRTIIESSVENIRTVEELVAFRDKVNTGLTYEGKTINLLADLDLSNVCGENINGQEISWEPIGTDKAYFKGTFDGNYHTLNNLYYNSNTNEYVGLFAQNNGTIQNLILGNVYVYNNLLGITGAMVGSNRGIVTNCGIKSGSVNKYVHKINSYIYTGGIVGTNAGVIENCYNKANITSKTDIDNGYTIEHVAGGITGSNSGTIENCYNTGDIMADGPSSISGGITGALGKGMIRNSYSIGNVKNGRTTRTGAMIGIEWGYNTNPLGKTLINSYCGTGSTYSYYYYQNGNLTSTSGKVSPTENLKNYASTLGIAFENDDSNINNEYPILKWQLESGIK